VKTQKCSRFFQSFCPILFGAVAHRIFFVLRIRTTESPSRGGGIPLPLLVGISMKPLPLKSILSFLLNGSFGCHMLSMSFGCMLSAVGWVEVVNF
jgi:hypothetical protein